MWGGWGGGGGRGWGGGWGGGGVAGIASVLMGRGMESAMVSEEAILVMVPAGVFRGVLEREGGLRDRLRGVVYASELYALVLGELAAGARDVAEAGRVVRRMVGSAGCEAGGGDGAEGV